MTHAGFPRRAGLEALGLELGGRISRGEEVVDEAFDALISEGPRKRSGRYWSCVRAAQVASRLLTRAQASDVLDVGAGVGKFCAIASLTSGKRVWGLERRGALVYEARQLVQRVGAEVVMIEGELTNVDPHRFNGFYFYNPFGEYLADDASRFDADCPRSLEAYLRDARKVEAWLLEARLGTAMVTYNGLGARIPVGFEVLHTTLVRDDVMRLWVKTKPSTTGDAFLELEGELLSPEQLASAENDSNPIISALSRRR